MTDQITRGLRDKPLEAAAGGRWAELREYLNRELSPVVSQARDIINRRFGRDVEVSADYAVEVRDETIFASTAGGSFTVTLPAAADWRRTIYVVIVDGAGCTLAPASGELLDGGSGSTVITANTVLRPDNTRPGFWRM